MRKLVLLLLLLGMAAGQIQAQTGQFWSEADQDFLLQTQKSLRDVYPQQFRSLALDLPALRNYLKKAPMEFTAEARKKPLLLDLPLPDGRWETFELVESPVLKPGLAAKYPSIKTYSARGLHDRSLTAHFDYTPKGFHAMIRTERGFAYIDPLALDQTEYYMAYYPADYDLESLDLPPMACGTTEIADDPIASEFDLPETPGQKSAETPVNLRVYDLAMSCTGEFSIAQGSTVELVLATMATIVNRNNEIFLPEAAFKFELIENNDLLVYLNPATDPFPNANLGFEILDLATTAITSIVPAVNFDVGHVLTLGCIDGIAGVASAGATCGQNKARGMTCFGTSNIDFIVVNVMAHELGHQFSALHSWSNCPNSPSGQLESGEAFEPGSGSTIMSYAGSCGDQNLQFSANDYFHVGSLDDIVPFTLQGNGNICPDIVPTENHYPEVSLLYENGFYIPISTPFELNAIGEDVDGDQLTYCWEQYDLGPTAPIGMPIGDGPSFRSLPPTTASNRYFPRLSFILNNDSGPHEVLPTYSRNLTFRCTVRDNSPEAGGVAWEEVKFKATAEAGPFLVTSPNTTGVVWKGGEQVEVTWDVANTDNSLVNCQQVDILLSTDGGNTWPYTLANATPNTGSAFVFVPDLSTSQARIRVQASQNVFFDLSNFNFQIEPADEAGYSFQVSSPISQQLCVPNTGEVDLSVGAFLDFDAPVTLEIVAGLPGNVPASFSQNPLNAGETSTLSLDFDAIGSNTDLAINVRATADGFDTLFQTIYFTLIYSGFDNLAMSSPPNGTSNVNTGLPSFAWEGSPFADTYDFQLATSPAFGNSIVDEGTFLPETEFDVNVVLEETTLYYWRVRARNLCGDSDWLPPFAFHTETLACNEFNSIDVPLGIPALGTPTRESELSIAAGGTINDVNVVNLTGYHDGVKDIAMRVISPEGTVVTLFSGICGNTAPFDLGLDDESPLVLTCPPTDGQPHQPQGSLSDFDGESTAGVWTLQVQVIDDFGAGGLVESWGLEFCASFDPKNPVLVNNETLLVQPGNLRLIETPTLLCEDEDNTPDELFYTVVTAPEHGTLYWNGQPVGVGGTFRQLSIDAGNVWYEHSGDGSEEDGFTFTVIDGTGGWIGITEFDIAVTEDAPVAVTEVNPAQELKVFPNPTTGELQVVFLQPQNGEVTARVFNLQGRELQRRELGLTGQQFGLDLSGLPTGVYFLQLQAGEKAFVQQVQVVR